MPHMTQHDATNEEMIEVIVVFKWPHDMVPEKVRAATLFEKPAKYKLGRVSRFPL